MSLVTMLTLGVFWRRLSPWIYRFWGRTMLRMAGITWSIEGEEYLRADRMKIITFNHGSLIDAFLVSAVMPERGTAAVKREVIYYPVVGWTLYLLGALLIDRQNGKNAHRTMNRAGARMAKERLSVFIAPEGTRRLGATLLPFKRGAMRLALDSGAEIVPLLIDGAYELHGPGKLLSTPGHVVLRFLPPRTPVALCAESVGRESEALREVYLTELARLRSDRVAAGTWAAEPLSAPA